MTIRQVQYAVAIILGLGLLAYGSRVITGIRAGRRRLGWGFSWGKVARIALLVIGLILWWIFWYTDLLFISLGFPDTFVTVRVSGEFGLSPAVFIWISWAVTLWFLALIAVTFVPKVKEPASVEATAGEAVVA